MSSVAVLPGLGRGERPRFAAWPVLGVAAAMLAVELSLAARYGIHRDELYFLACARHLAWGYVDQPPLVPAVARLVLDLFGPSVFWLRFVPAVAGAATVVLSGLMARELGGGVIAQTVAAVAAGTTPQALAAFHTLSTAAFDIFFWALILYLVVRLLRAADPRWWVAVGVAVGAALLNKLNVVFLVAGLAGGLMLSGDRRLLLNRWAAAAVVVAVVIASPDLVWNASHGWAQLTMLHRLHQENSSLGASLAFIPAQLIVAGPVLAFVWIPGVRLLLRHPFGRPLSVTFLILLLVYALGGAKPYYLAGMYYPLFAGGGLALEERWSGLRTYSWRGRRLGWFLAAAIAAAIVALPLTLPVVPERSLPKGSWEQNINKDLSATVGWPDFAHQVAGVAATLPPAERTRLVIYAGDYGAAGAIDLWGPQLGLPRAISGHNNYWWWGPGRSPDDSTTIAINLPRDYLLTIFGQVRPAGTVTAPHGVWTEERGEPIWICTDQRLTWAAAWPAARHYG